MIEVEKFLSLNSSNEDKIKEFKSFFPNILVSKDDIIEPDSDPITVAVYKASKVGPYVIIDDASLDVEGENVGVNVKYLSGNLPLYIGKKAIFRVIVAYLDKDIVRVFNSEVSGRISLPRGDGYGFDNFFLPHNSKKTLGEFKDELNHPRIISIKKLINNQPTLECDPIFNWTGSWQNSY